MDLKEIQYNLNFMRTLLHSENPGKEEYCKSIVDDTLHRLEEICSNEAEVKTKKRKDKKDV